MNHESNPERGANKVSAYPHARQTTENPVFYTIPAIP